MNDRGYGGNHPVEFQNMQNQLKSAKSSLAGQKALQVLIFFLIFVARLLITIIAAWKPQNLNDQINNNLSNNNLNY